MNHYRNVFLITFNQAEYFVYLSMLKTKKPRFLEYQKKKGRRNVRLRIE